ncbi:MAG: FCD domain-containing protein [Bacilli bacterium]
MRNINAEFARMIDQQQPFRAMEVDEQFHNLIVDLADNPYMTSYISTLQMHIRRLKYVFLRQPVALTRESVAVHAAIIEGFERRDSDAVARTLRQNWLRPMNELYAVIGESGQTGN